MTIKYKTEGCAEIPTDNRVSALAVNWIKDEPSLHIYQGSARIELGKGQILALIDVLRHVADDLKS